MGNKLFQGQPMSFRGAGEAREPGIQEHGRSPRSFRDPVFMVSGPALRASRNDGVVRVMKRRYWFSVMGLMLSLLAVGCADAGSTSDNDKRGVFYGGVRAGGTRP
jgi:hypothetical protein